MMTGISLPLALLNFSALPTSLKPIKEIGLGALAAVCVLAVAWTLLKVIFPKMAAIAWTTSKEALAQPLFYMLLAFGAFMIVLLLYLPYYTFGEDTKFFEDNALTLVMLLAIILSLWTASTSVADEIEGRTALTVLCKPISRRDFVLGKFFGILGPVAIMFIILGAFYLTFVSIKVVYDARECSMPEPNSAACYAEVVRMAPGLLLAFMEATVMAAISVAISTRLGLLPNLVICFSIYVLGNLVPTLAKSAMGQMAIVPFLADLLSAILPVLDHFNIYGPISTGASVPPAYLGLAGLYCLAYTSLAMFVALLMVEDRDLA
jgi:ABC-type transport system involved in multi-copper enzyme maturation permease subunit